MTSNPLFGAQTTAADVVSALGQHVKDKHVLITGAGLGGLSEHVIMALASASPASITITGRKPQKLQDMAVATNKAWPKVSVKSVVMDLSSQKSVRHAASTVLAFDHDIDILINNAGIMALSDRQLSEDGIEIQLATNHIGHFLFTNLIFPKLASSASKIADKVPPYQARVVTLSSSAHVFSPIRFSDPNFEQLASSLPASERPISDSYEGMGLPDSPTDPYSAWAAYGQAKTATVLFAIALNARHLKSKGILSVTLDPGDVKSDLNRYLPEQDLNILENHEQITWKTPEQGAATHCVAALDPKLNADGSIYLADCQISEAESFAVDRQAAEKLWAMSEKIVGQTFSW